MDLIKDLTCSFIKYLTQNDPYDKNIKTFKVLLRQKIGLVRFLIGMLFQVRLYRRAHYKRIQRGSVKGVWFAKDASRRSEEQIAAGEGPVMLYIHGGAFISGQAKMWSEWQLDIIEDHAKQFKKDLAVFNVDYSLAPEQVFPRQWHECRSAVDYLMRSLAVHPARLFVAGDSAGGNLALQTLFELDVSNSLAGLLLFSPWVCPTTQLAVLGLVKNDDKKLKESAAHGSWVENEGTDYITGEFGSQGIVSYIGKGMSYEEAYHSKQINPLYRTAKEYGTLPDLIIIYGEVERLRDEIVEFADEAKRHCGDVEVHAGKGGAHDWALSKDIEPEPGAYHKMLGTTSAWIEKKMIHA